MKHEKHYHNSVNGLAVRDFRPLSFKWRQSASLAILKSLQIGQSKTLSTISEQFSCMYINRFKKNLGLGLIQGQKSEDKKLAGAWFLLTSVLLSH